MFNTWLNKISITNIWFGSHHHAKSFVDTKTDMNKYLVVANLVQICIVIICAAKNSFLNIGEIRPFLVSIYIRIYIYKEVRCR